MSRRSVQSDENSDDERSDVDSSFTSSSSEDSLPEAPNHNDEQADRFRLLIIGKSGCGKTTILSKVCGEEVADRPSTTRGKHNIEREMEFKENKLFIVHDSEGFEAGQDDEFEVVLNFIKSRGKTANPKDRLHAIWYCLTTKSRPIQQSEELFFGVKHDVPIVAIFTKFDLFVEEQLQELMNGQDIMDEEEEEELVQQAGEIAKQKFGEHYKGALLKKPHPPEVVVSLSEIHESTPKDGRLTELITATTTALRLEAKNRSRQERAGARRLAGLFAAAQQADLIEKFRWSIYNATPETIIQGRARAAASRKRPLLIKLWDVDLINNKPLLSSFKAHVEDHPQTFGNSEGPTHRKRKELKWIEREGCRCLQLIADLTVIMTEIFLLKIKDEAAIQEIVERYPSTPAFPYIRNEILRLRLWIGRVTHEPQFQLFRFRNDLRIIIQGAAKESLLANFDR